MDHPSEISALLLITLMSDEGQGRQHSILLAETFWCQSVLARHFGLFQVYFSKACNFEYPLGQFSSQSQSFKVVDKCGHLPPT